MNTFYPYKDNNELIYILQLIIAIICIFSCVENLQSRWLLSKQFSLWPF